MPLRRGICRPSQTETDDLERLRDFASKAGEFLKRFPVPDTFIGRKTQEPFPKATSLRVPRRTDSRQMPVDDGRATKRPLILVVEDEWFLQADLMDALGNGGFDADAVFSGEEALELFTS